jgi:regulator of RNase E activity RraB
MSNSSLHRLATKKEEARKIVLEISNFGVNEDQKYEIIHGIVMTLENNDALKELSSVIKKYKKTFNEEETQSINLKDKLILD